MLEKMVKSYALQHPITFTEDISMVLTPVLIRLVAGLSPKLAFAHQHYSPGKKWDIWYMECR